MRKETAVKILKVLQKHRRIRNHHTNGRYSIDPFIDKAASLLEEGKPFKMALPAFHCKSINPESVLGATPDGGEEEAIKNLEEICDEIKEVYAPGCELLIVQEGHFYTDIKITPADDVIDEYESCVRKMTHHPMIRFTNIMENFSDSYDEARRIIFEKYMRSLQEVERLVREDEFMKSRYTVYKKFALQEFIPILMPHLTKGEMRKYSKELAYEWFRRYLVFKDICSDLFQKYFRLSILSYYSQSGSFSINLIKNASGYGMPWFHVLLKKADGSLALIKKHEAEEMGYELIYKNHKPWYYIEKR